MRAGVAILISDKIDLKVKITRDKEGHHITIKGSIQEEDIVPNIGAPQHMRQTLTDIKGGINSNTIIISSVQSLSRVRLFATP